MFQKYQEFTTEYHFTSVTTVNEKRPTLKSPRPQLTRSMRKVSKVPPNRVAPLHGLNREVSAPPCLNYNEYSSK